MRTLMNNTLGFWWVLIFLTLLTACQFDVTITDPEKALQLNPTEPPSPSEPLPAPSSPNNSSPTTVSISSPVNNSTKISPILFTITFSDPVTEFNLNHIHVVSGSGTKQNLLATGVPNQYSFEWIPASDGLYSFKIDEGVVKNTGGVNNTASNTVDVVFDQTGPLPPTITLLGVPPDSLIDSPSLSFSSGVDSASGWSHDEIRLLKSLDGTILVPWNAFVSGHSLSSLSLTQGESYYYQIRSVDKVGNPSSSVSSSSWIATSNSAIDSLDPNYKAILSSLPMTVDSVNPLNISVSGVSVTHYKYKLGISGSIDCSAAVNYSAGSIPVATPITHDLSSYPDGTSLTLCVRGGQSGVAFQAPSVSSSFSWIKDTVVEANITNNIGQILIDSFLPLNLQFSLSQAKPYDVTLYFVVTGTADANDHNLTSGEVTIPAGQTTTTINYQLLRNPNINSEKSLDIHILRSSRPGVVAGALSTQWNIIRDADGPAPLTVSQISETNSTNCVIKSNGALYCWGRNNSGQVGNSTTGYSTPNPTLIDSGVTYAKVTSGGNHTCGITTTGVLKCWGINSNGQIGDASTTQRSTPKIIDPGTTYLTISAGVLHTCGITTSDILKCWGSNTLGKLGDGTTTQSTSPKIIDPGTTYLAVSAGADYTCGITKTHLLKCWGKNAEGQLGDGTTTSPVLSPTIIDSETLYSQVQTASTHTCGITTSNALKCWGTNASVGKLGDGTTDPRPSPTLIDSGTTYLKITVGTNNTCGLTMSGAAKCWGSNSSGQLGTGDFTQQLLPTPIEIGEIFTDISTGGDTTCALHSSGALKCWGSNSSGQQGNGQAGAIGTGVLPTPVDTPTTYVEIATGDQTCGLTSTGQIKCWGSGGLGGLGDGSLRRRTLPTLIHDSSRTYKKITSKLPTHRCAINSLNELYCWGLNADGKIGDDTTINRVSPKHIDYGTYYAQISVGSTISCGITLDGILKCWGRSNYGELGDGVTPPSISKTPIIVDPGVTYKYIDSGSTHVCGITSADKLKCWGSNSHGKLGDNSTTNRNTPTPIDATTDYAVVSIGGRHSCAITTTGILKCWGYNYYNNLGDGTSTNSSIPIIIDPGVSYSSIAVNADHSCGITTTGVLKCWGLNWFGELGYGLLPDHKKIPTVIDDGVSYSKVSVANYYTCGITQAGLLKCWGKMEVKLGIAPYTWSWIPRFVQHLSEP